MTNAPMHLLHASEQVSTQATTFSRRMAFSVLTLGQRRQQAAAYPHSLPTEDLRSSPRSRCSALNLVSFQEVARRAAPMVPMFADGADPLPMSHTARAALLSSKPRNQVQVGTLRVLQCTVCITCPLYQEVSLQSLSASSCCSYVPEASPPALSCLIHHLCVSNISRAFRLRPVHGRSYQPRTCPLFALQVFHSRGRTAPCISLVQ